MKVAGAASMPSGAVNEDGVGYLGNPDNIAAAWVLDGVTGINDTTLPGIGNDASWFVDRVDRHLRALLPHAGQAVDLVSELVDHLIADIEEACGEARMPTAYDPPAACLMLIRRTRAGWEAIRLGDSCLLARQHDDTLLRMVDFPNDPFDAWFRDESHRLRLSGIMAVADIKRALLPALFENRRRRNRPGGYGVLEADRVCLHFLEVREFADVDGILLASDGYMRLADCYQQMSESELLAESIKPGGIDELMARLRAIEAADETCIAYPRHKPRDDATAIALRP
jgi:hypothetical protein